MIDSYSNLPIGKYIEITRIVRDETLPEVDRQVRMLSVLSGRTEDDILNAPITDFAELSRTARFLERPPEAKPEARDVYELGDFRLVPLKDARRMTTAQYIDFQTFGRKADDNIVEMLSCLLVPEGIRYNDGYDILEVQAAIRERMDCVSALGVYAFFFESLRTSMRGILTSCRRAARKAEMAPETRKELNARIAEAMRLLRPAGAGSAASTGSRRRAAASGTRSGR